MIKDRGQLVTLQVSANVDWLIRANRAANELGISRSDLIRRSVDYSFWQTGVILKPKELTHGGYYSTSVIVVVPDSIREMPRG